MSWPTSSISCFGTEMEKETVLKEQLGHNLQKRCGSQGLTGDRRAARYPRWELGKHEGIAGQWLRYLAMDFCSS